MDKRVKYSDAIEWHFKTTLGGYDFQHSRIQHNNKKFYKVKFRVKDSLKQNVVYLNPEKIKEMIIPRYKKALS